MEEQDLTQSV